MHEGPTHARRPGKKPQYQTLKNGGANLGFEQKLWQAADKLRGHMDAAEYKHVVLGLVFLKYISDAFEEHRRELERKVADSSSEYYVREPAARYEVIEDRDEYASENVFWVPKEARWSYLQANAKQPTIGKLIDDAMVAIEKENESLKGVLPKVWGGKTPSVSVGLTPQVAPAPSERHGAPIPASTLCVPGGGPRGAAAW